MLEFDCFATRYQAQHATSIRLSGEGPDYFAKYKVDDLSKTLDRLGKKPKRILDFGAGVGNSLPFMREAFSASEIVLLDPSSNCLNIAQWRFPNQAVFQHFDGDVVPFEAHYFDLVFAACVFHHIPEEQHVALLREVYRVLTYEGSFFLFEHNPWNPLTLYAVRNCPFDENAALIPSSAMRRQVASAGFSDIKIAYRIFFPRMFSFLRPIERLLTSVPLGAQYFIHAIKRPA